MFTNVIISMASLDHSEVKLHQTGLLINVVILTKFPSLAAQIVSSIWHFYSRPGNSISVDSAQSIQIVANICQNVCRDREYSVWADTWLNHYTSRVRLSTFLLNSLGRRSLEPIHVSLKTVHKHVMFTNMCPRQRGWCVLITCDRKTS